MVPSIGPAYSASKSVISVVMAVVAVITVVNVAGTAEVIANVVDTDGVAASVLESSEVDDRGGVVDSESVAERAVVTVTTGVRRGKTRDGLVGVAVTVEVTPTCAAIVEGCPPIAGSALLFAWPSPTACTGI